jgi:hypothetical protein
MRKQQIALLGVALIVLVGVSESLTDSIRVAARVGYGPVPPPHKGPSPSAPPSAQARDLAAFRSSTIPVAVDGAAAPGSIPDKVAYRHFILSGLSRGDGGAAAIVRQRAVLRKVGLSTSDSVALTHTLASIASRLDQLPAMIEDLPSRRLAREAVLDQAKQELYIGLSPAGVARLDAYVKDRVKLRITIYGEIPR